MPLPCPSSQKSVLLAGLVAFSTLAAAEGPATTAAFTPLDAVRCEWARKPPVLSPEAVAALAPADRARLELSLKRIGAPGAQALLPSWLETPTASAWEAKALEASTPQERFTALSFLNRLKSTKALTALASLNGTDAASWPADLQLENLVATARINGCPIPDHLPVFLNALKKVSKDDPVREAAARLRLILAGQEKGELRLPDTSNLFYLDAWNRGPWEPRAKDHLTFLAGALTSTFNPGPAQRYVEGLPIQGAPLATPLVLKALRSPFILVRLAALDYFEKLPALEPDTFAEIKNGAFRNYAGPLCSGFAAVLRKHAPADADRYDRFLLGNDDVPALTAALEDMPQPPANLEAMVKRLWKTPAYDAVQVFLPALERWKLPEDQRKAILARFLDHPCWTARLDAFNLLVKLAPATAWPTVPSPSFVEEAILDEALRLAKAGKPVRMRITFDRYRKLVLKLDPVNAPINVANLVLLARRGFFNGLTVPRVVPDFVVQMGSPSDTMDGGPGYTVRCENSLDWYGPGSVGMALSGKDTGGSQFFITTNATPHLTGHYTRVGELENVHSGIELLDGLELGTKIVSVEVF